ncbi:MAG: quinone-dependent dihydroorotate dehydrogenase [Pyrinomonadaceae bacterium]
MLYRSLLRPLLFRLPPETAHELALHSLHFALGTSFARNLAAKHFNSTARFGELRRFGLPFANPIGLAAGFDKNGHVAREFAALGFGFVEVGTVTHEAQPGNARPRLFRLPLDKALINRAGFNNDGASALAHQLARKRPACVLGINIGKSRTVSIEDAVPDYLASFNLIRSHADYITINVSSPNTPNLRELQQPDALRALLNALQKRNDDIASSTQKQGRVPLLLKIAPDLTVRQLETIIEVALNAKIDGIVATNTTTNRADLRTDARRVEACGAGGLSGAPLRARSTEIIAAIYRLTDGQLPIVGVGGIFTAADAWEKICAGASLLQLYTGLIYEGIGVVRRINDELAGILEQNNFHSLDEAVGCRATELAAA